MRFEDVAIAEARLAVREFDHALHWVAQPRAGPKGPLAVEVWVFDEELARVLLVNHPWRGWVPPGGKVEPDETIRDAARRELFEETGLRPDLLSRPAAASVRSYHPDWGPTLGLSYAAIADAGVPLVAEVGQPVAWTPIDQDWASYFPDDPDRIRWHARWLANR